LELIRDTRKPAGSATPLIDPISPAKAAITSSPAPEQVKPFPMVPTPGSAFGVPLPTTPDHHPEQQEDYLWGV